MNHIQITHNPFTVETTFLINEQTPAAGCKLSSYKSSRLQVWVERLFDELSELFNGDNRFHVTFTGVEPDYLDIQEVARTAIDAGMQIELEWQATVPSEQRLEQIRALISEAHAHPKFDQFIRDNNEVRNSIEEAFNRDFDVYVVATMSSGKSTLINAMLGRDLLPAANEATTATIARITDNDQMRDRFSAQRYNRSNQLVGQEDDVDLACLEQWNQLEDTKQINIEGNIVAIREREDVRLVLTDTPGPNNSQDEEHQRTTMGFIQDSKRNPLILYVLNASQLGTKDDKNLLSVSEALSLTLIEDTIRPLLPNGMLKALQGRFQHARKKLENMADENLAARWMSKVASVRPELNLQAPSISAEILETIQLALLEERQIACRYYSAHGNKTSELTLNPLALVQRGVATYLIGTADHYSDLRQYAVHRFLNVEILPAACEGAAQFDLPQYLASDALQFGGPQKISLQAWVSESLARLLRETPLAEDMALQACEGGYRLTATVSDSWQLNWWMLSQGDGLVVEQPVELRHKLLETLRGTLQRYEQATA